MSRLHLYGQTAAQLREMCVDWYVLPVAAHLLRERPEARSVIFAVRAVREAVPVHAFFAAPTERPAWPTPTIPLGDAADRICLRLFGARPADLFDPVSFAAAFRPCARWDGGWSPFITVRRAGNRVQLEGLGTFHRKEEFWDPGFSLSVPNRTVDQVLEELSLLDASAQILWRMEMALDAYDATENHPAENENLKWAVNYLDWVLASV